MTINTFSSGVNTTFSTELNENFNSSIIRRNSGSLDTTEYSQTGIYGWTDMGYSKTFTCPESSNMLLSFRLQYDAKYASSYVGALRVKIVNNTNGEVGYFSNSSISIQFSSSTGYDNSIGGILSTSYTSYDEYSSIYLVSGAAEYLNNSKAIQSGASYTITIEARSTNAVSSFNTTDVYIKNITPTLYWSFMGDDTVSGWA